MPKSIGSTITMIVFLTACCGTINYAQTELYAVLDHPEVQSPGMLEMNSASFFKTKGVKLNISNDFEIARFNLVYVPKGADPVEVTNREPGFNVRSQQLIDRAQSGDAYYFDKIVAKSPNMVDEKDWLKLNSLVIKIK